MLLQCCNTVKDLFAQKQLKCALNSDVCVQDCWRGGTGGKQPSCIFLRGAKGKECPFNGTMYFFNNV